MIYINGNPETQSFKTLKEICEAHSPDPEAVATALNGDFIPKLKRATTYINHGDQIEIVAPLEGG